MTPMISSDGELLRLVVAGDDHAFTELYRRHQGPVYRFALLMSGRHNIAEEVTQEVFLMLIRAPHRYDPALGSLPTYLYGVARNYVLRALKRERHFVSLGEDSEDGLHVLVAQDDPFGDCTRNEVIRLVRQAVLTLPARYREVVVLCDFQEMSCADAAVALGCAVGTVNSRLHRGHALLLRKLHAAELDSSTAESQRLRCFA
ncbi:MAG: RNA polymerase sigma factor [Pyrinomonadaceae bacterium]